MAILDITVNEDPAGAGFLTVFDNVGGCATLYYVNIDHVIGETLKITLSAIIGSPNVLGTGDPNYVLGSNYVTTLHNSFGIIIENSGIPGTNNTVTVTVDNITTTDSDSVILTRINTGDPC